MNASQALSLLDNSNQSFDNNLYGGRSIKPSNISKYILDHNDELVKAIGIIYNEAKANANLIIDNYSVSVKYSNNDGKPFLHWKRPTDNVDRTFLTEMV